MRHAARRFQGNSNKLPWSSMMRRVPAWVRIRATMTYTLATRSGKPDRVIRSRIVPVILARCLCAGLLAGLMIGCQETGPAASDWRAGPAPGPAPETMIKPPDPAKVWPPRAVWAVRETYESPERIAELMERCRDTGFNTVLFQVRGNGTAFYRSRIEPLAYEYRNGDPGFDPLEVACREAHRRGLALHAWLNVLPAWRGGKPPADPRQLYNARPEWFLYDQKGERQPLNPTFYVSLNPCLPAVRDYLVEVFVDIAKRYPVDGLHMDYIRFPIEVSPRGSDYPHDRQTLELYRKSGGKDPLKDKAAWSRWRTGQVTQLVKQIRVATGRARPGIRLTAACAPDIAGARERYYQDGPAWLRDRLVDAVFVMNYTADTAQFSRRHDAWQKAAAGGLVAPGISPGIPGDRSDAVTIEQLKLADRWGRGFAIFSASSLFSDRPRSRQCLEALRPVLQAMQSRTVAIHGGVSARSDG